jgi:Ulp1 family protease
MHELHRKQEEDKQEEEKHQQSDDGMEETESRDEISFLDTDTRWRLEKEARQAALDLATEQASREIVVIDEKTADIVFKEKFTLPSGESLYDSDLTCLGAERWLSGAVISFYAKAIDTFRDQERKRKMYIMDTEFWEHAQDMLHTPLKAAMEKLKKSVKWVGYEPDVLIPVLQNAHWTLLLVELSKGQIHHYDSAQGTQCLEGKAICKTMATIMESLYEWKKWKWQVVYGLPQQTNTFDCGVYVCRFIDFIFGHLSEEEMKGWLSLNWSMMQRHATIAVIRKFQDGNKSSFHELHADRVFRTNHIFSSRLDYSGLVESQHIWNGKVNEELANRIKVEYSRT